MAKKTQLESGTTTKTPIKRLELRRETVRELRVRTGVQTGTGAGDSRLPGFGSNGPIISTGSISRSASASWSGSMLPPSDHPV